MIISAMKKLKDTNSVKIFPAKHYIVDDDSRLDSTKSIRQELENWLPNLPNE